MRTSGAVVPRNLLVTTYLIIISFDHCRLIYLHQLTCYIDIVIIEQTLLQIRDAYDYDIYKNHCVGHSVIDIY